MLRVPSCGPLFFFLSLLNCQIFRENFPNYQFEISSLSTYTFLFFFIAPALPYNMLQISPVCLFLPYEIKLNVGRDLLLFIPCNIPSALWKVLSQWEKGCWRSPRFSHVVSIQLMLKEQVKKLMNEEDHTRSWVKALDHNNLTITLLGKISILHCVE